MTATKTGGAGAAAGMLAETKRVFDAASAEEEQLALRDPVTAEEMLEAREALGPEAGRLALVRHAREERGRGRPPGSRNKRTEDFARYILSFGQDPAITLIQIASTQPEVLIEASQQEKVHSYSKYNEPRIVIERMTYDAAQALRVRCAEALMGFIHAKKPVAVDINASGDFNLIVPGLNISEEGAQKIVDGEFAEIGEWRGGDEPQ
jgi:hypothetical protein